MWQRILMYQAVPAMRTAAWTQVQKVYLSVPLPTVDMPGHDFSHLNGATQDLTISWLERTMLVDAEIAPPPAQLPKAQLSRPIQQPAAEAVSNVWDEWDSPIAPRPREKDARDTSIVPSSRINEATPDEWDEWDSPVVPPPRPKEAVPDEWDAPIVHTAPTTVTTKSPNGSDPLLSYDERLERLAAVFKQVGLPITSSAASGAGSASSGDSVGEIGICQAMQPWRGRIVVAGTRPADQPGGTPAMPLAMSLKVR